MKNKVALVTGATSGIVWLLSNEASFVTGSTLVMDGGFIS
ncbi:SDR family NAD(P)-dependent oxidoreductase [Clostridium sp. DJ247]|nr:SDR family NAD(P)-dependent oxidoreductase [Clostridium sp. DJ247]MBC2579113.1 SDR family oxidoreductase [Clostridium sp. DJ247]